MKTIKIPKKEAVKEHKQLLNVLKSGSSKQKALEIKKQSNELKKYKKA